MNNKRYFSNNSEFLDIKEVQALLNIKAPFEIQTGKSHFILAK